MVNFSSAHISDNQVAEMERAVQSEITAAVGGLSKYRRTILFAITAVLVMAIAAAFAATKVNNVIAGLAERQLVDLAEENTTKDAQHIQSMIIGGQVMSSMDHGSMTMNQDLSMGTGTMPSGTNDMSSDNSMAMAPGDTGGGETGPLTLDMLISPDGLPAHFGNLVEGFGVLESRLFSPNGEVRWSTDSYTNGEFDRTDSRVKQAVDGTISSTLVRDRVLVGLDGELRTVDVVETFVPLRDSPSSPVVAVLEINREVGTDLGQLVNETKSTVVWTTVVTMVGLFLALVEFMVVSDRMIYQSNQKQIALVAIQLAERDREQQDSMRAQQKIASSEKLAAMGQMSAGVAHDLRNPLGAIKNAAYIMKKRLTADGAIEANPKIGQYLDMINNQVARSNGIITDLMTFARVVPLELTKTRLDEVLEESLNTMLKAEKVEISRHLDPNLSAVMADSEQLQRVFLNLCNNSQDAMPNGGKLTVTAWNVEDSVEIAFTDAGEGISDENIERIFDPLFTTKAKGTGLGLANCQEIIQRHGGTISAERNDVQTGGSTFTVKLPAASEQQQAGEQLPHES